MILSNIRKERIEEVYKNKDKLNGIEYIEVLYDDMKRNPILLVYCVKEISEEDISRHFIVKFEGGVRVRNVIAKSVEKFEKFKVSNEYVIDVEEEDERKIIVVTPSEIGDFSPYTLLITKYEDTNEPPDNFDAMLSSYVFNFHIQCVTDIDCLKEDELFIPPKEEPLLDYMAKDYQSYRRLMLNRFKVENPGWGDPNIADYGTALIELLAYFGDHLSYYQDSVSTEAYLGTARKRVSAKRHARLLDYVMHEGCNARAWVYFEVEAPKTIPKGTKLLTGKENIDSVIVKQNEYESLKDTELVFETKYNKRMYPSLNIINFYTWGNTDTCLFEGSTSAVLQNESHIMFETLFFVDGDLGSQKNEIIEIFRKDFDVRWVDKDSRIRRDNNKIILENQEGTHKAEFKLNSDEITSLLIDDRIIRDLYIIKDGNGKKRVCYLTLKPGDIVIFEEIYKPGVTYVDATKRMAVRLTYVKPSTCKLRNKPIVEIQWMKEDATPFSLNLEKHTRACDGKVLTNTVVNGNVVLVDHGDEINEEIILPYNVLQVKLENKPVTQSISHNPYEPASKIRQVDPRETLPNIYLMELEQVVKKEKLCWKPIDEVKWLPRRDTLSSGMFQKEFKLEVNNEGNAILLFNKSARGTGLKKFKAYYRVGNGSTGNVGADSINRIVDIPESEFSQVKVVTNPLPASGGMDPEHIEVVRQDAPAAFMVQERIVIDDDFTELLGRQSDVQRAVALRKWTGCWYTYHVMIDRMEGKPLDDQFIQEIGQVIEKYRLAGSDFKIIEPRYVPINLEIKVCAKPDQFNSEIKERILDEFSNKLLKDGRRGFFHPDNFTFGEDIIPSKIIERGYQTPGVDSLKMVKFERADFLERDSDEASTHINVITISDFEIARLDNDPNFPEYGGFKVKVAGGIT